MEWVAVLCLIFMNTQLSQSLYAGDLSDLIYDLQQRRYNPKKGYPTVGGAPEHPARFVNDPGIHLGVDLLRPSPGRLNLHRSPHSYTPKPLLRSRRKEQIHKMNEDFTVTSGKLDFFKNIYEKAIKKLEIKDKRNSWRRETRLEDLPRSEKVLPGHTLIKPSKTMLKSAAAYHKEDKAGRLVYGNIDNLGITRGKTPFRLKYSDFRKLNDFLRRYSQRRTDNLPRSEKLIPGHTLIKPSKTMLKSAAAYHKEDTAGRLVYGNMDNLGITHGKTPYRLKYSDFRKQSELLDFLVNNLRRHYFHRNVDFILKRPEYPEELPEAEPIHPGHTLLRPALGMLKSQIKFPQAESGGLVYGNANNLGITYGKTGERVKYTHFRKANLLERILETVRELNKDKRNKVGHERWKDLMIDRKEKEDVNDAAEILDDVDAVNNGNNGIYKIKTDEFRFVHYSHQELSFDKPHIIQDFRKDGTRYRERDASYMNNETENNCTRDSEQTSSKDTEDEKNPGNPYTIHKNAYKMNWIWNTQLGDHMNINPYGPQFANLGPSGAELFFGRKWWYFNQDDYKPFR